MSGLSTLRVELRRQGGALAAAVRDRDAGDGDHDGASGPAQVVATGPRTAGRGTEYELLLEMILEGTYLHYGPRRVVDPDDRDLTLLLGDQLYALGLARLAALDDLHAVAELADVISLVAKANAASDRDLADAVWEAGAAAIGWGSSEQLVAAKGLARAGEAGASGALRAAARTLRDGAA